MRDGAPLPLDREAQRQVERHWLAARSTGVLDPGVRPVVRESWGRSLRARIPATLSTAPLVWDEAGLALARERSDWLELARGAVAAQQGAYAEGGHILTLFDATGRMLLAEGDPGALEGLEGINFRPGALWAEQAVGTNGPGTALATGRPVHVVGAEHFCEAWHPWHCAAVAFRDPLTGEVQGAVDISGFREAAHPHTLTLSIAVAIAIEQMLAARDAERRVLLLRRFGDLTGRWPGDALVAVDRTGTVVAASHSVPAALHPLAPAPERLRATLAEAVRTSATDAPREVRLPCGPEPLGATLYPVMEGWTPVGACLVVRPPVPPRAVPADTARRIARGRPGGETRYTLHDLVGEAPALVEAHRVALVAAANSLPVLLLGESGTGKEVFAQGIHAASGRAGKPFVAVNCAALPRELIEGELFGYVGGAFSGARREGSAGKFEAADGGTLFLDELGELPPSAQAALLRVLQEGEVTRVGAARSRPVDVRVIAATNCDLAAALASGALRRDLYYRLGVLTIELPPLRERPADVPRLARRFLAEAETELGRTGHTFAPEVLRAFAAHSWPGNVRELKNLVRRLVALASTAEIGLADLPPALRAAAGAGTSTTPSGAYVQRGGEDPAARAARERLSRAVERAGTMAEAAALLGVTRSTLYRQLARHGLRPGRAVRGEE